MVYCVLGSLDLLRWIYSLTNSDVMCWFGVEVVGPIELHEISEALLTKIQFISLHFA